MDIFKQRAELSGLVDVIGFDIAPAITNKGDHYTTHLVKGKKYPATLYEKELLERIMRDHFNHFCPAFYGRAFDSIIDYYADNKWVENNIEYYVIRGKIKLKNK